MRIENVQKYLRETWLDSLRPWTDTWKAFKVTQPNSPNLSLLSSNLFFAGTHEYHSVITLIKSNPGDLPKLFQRLLSRKRPYSIIYTSLKPHTTQIPSQDTTTMTKRSSSLSLFFFTNFLFFSLSSYPNCHFCFSVFLSAEIFNRAFHSLALKIKRKLNDR